MLTFTQKNAVRRPEIHEQVCIDKYTNYANQTKSPQLKTYSWTMLLRNSSILTVLTSCSVVSCPRPVRVSRGSNSENQTGNSSQASQMQGRWLISRMLPCVMTC